MNKILIIQKSENNKSISTKNFTLVLQIIFICVNVDHRTHLDITIDCKTFFFVFNETEIVDAVKLIFSFGVKLGEQHDTIYIHPL